MSEIINGEMTRVMALHALAYCERLFYLEEVEELYLQDERVFAGRELHENLLEDDGDQLDQVSVSSEKLGLTGKVDAIRHRNGSYTPYEHKKGRAFKVEGEKPQAWESDILQVSAYGMLLEEFFGRTIKEGRVRYHEDNVTVRVPLDDDNRYKVHDAIKRACRLRNLSERPPIAENENLCLKCSLAPVCLPEEERLIDDPDWETVRLFPPNIEKNVVHVLSSRAKVKRSKETIIVQSPENGQRKLPIEEIESIILHGNAQITTQALQALAWRDIPVHFFTRGGTYICGTSPGVGNVQRRLRQYKTLSDESMKVKLARKLAMAKVESQLRYTLRSTTNMKPRPNDLKANLDSIRGSIKNISTADTIDSIRGYEGMAAREYFATLKYTQKDDIPDELRFDGRNRRPPRDRFNAALSYGYSLLYRSVYQAIISVGLEPAIGFYHTPRSAAFPLVLDLIELFRLPVWDIALIGSINKKRWDIDADFEVCRDHVWLSRDGMRKAIEIYEKRLNDMWKHPVLDYSISYARMMELEVRLLEKEWSGKPGLFARARLR